jgi:hypothetical protein
MRFRKLYIVREDRRAIKQRRAYLCAQLLILRAAKGKGEQFAPGQPISLGVNERNLVVSYNRAREKYS